jgi:hypothetical protein
MILGMQINALQPVQLHTTRSSADHGRLSLRRHHGMLQPTKSFRDCNPLRYRLAEPMSSTR